MSSSESLPGQKTPTPVDLLVLEHRGFGTPLDYINRLARRYHNSPLADSVSSAAKFIDRLSYAHCDGMEYDGQAGRAFLRGELLGLSTAELTLGQTALAQLRSSPLPSMVTASGELNTQEEQRRVEIIRRQAHLGFSAAVGLQELILHWQPKIMPEVGFRGYVPQGFGFIMFFVQGIEQERASPQGLKELEAFANGKVEAINWDAAAAAELPGFGDQPDG